MVRGIRSCLTLVGLVVVVLAGFVAYSVLGHARQQQAAPAPAASAAAGAQAGSVEARLASAEAGIRQQAAAGQHRPASFSLSDPEMTAEVNQAIARGQVQAPVSAVEVHAMPGVVNINGKATTAIVSVPFTMTAVPRVVGGKAQLQVTGIDFGGLPVPGPLAAQMTNAVGSDNVLGDLPFTVTSFRSEQGRVVLEGTT